MNRITDAISADHSDLLACSDRISQTEDADERNRFQNQLVWELARHVVGEELVLYPALEKHLRDEDVHLRDEDVDVEERERDETVSDNSVTSILHQYTGPPANAHQIKEKLQVFQNLAASDPRFFPTMTILMDDVATHVHRKETVDLVKLENAITSEESERLARQFDRTKIFAPTRAHPDRSPFDTAVALMMAPLDHVQDLFRRWPKGESHLHSPMG